MGKLIAVVEPSGWNCLKPVEESLVGIVILGNGSEGALGKLVVVAVVAEGGGAFGKIAQIGFVLLIEQLVLGGGAVGYRFDVLGETTRDGEEEEQTISKVHGCMQSIRGKV